MKQFLFLFVGLLVCAYRGVGRWWSWWVAQAKHESGNYTNTLFNKARNPWGLGVGPKSGRRTGIVSIPEGDKASYRTWWAVWMDRIDWDPQGAQQLDVSGYWHRVVIENPGVWGSGTQPYVDAVLRKWQELPKLMRGTGDTPVPNWAKALMLLVIPVSIVAAILVVRWVYRRVRRIIKR